MVDSEQTKTELAKPRPATAGYITPYRGGLLGDFNTRPLFTSWYADSMLLDPQVWLALAVLDGPLSQAEVEVESADVQLKTWIQEQWSRIWDTAGRYILTAKYYGWMAGEVMFRENNGLIEFDRLEHRHPRDCYPLVGLSSQSYKPNKIEGQLVAVEFRNTKNRNGNVRLRFPKALWITYDERFGSYYGWSALDHVFTPWWDKNCEGGAVALRRLRMGKDAWVGDVITYDRDEVFIRDGVEISAAQVAREMCELRASGGVMQFPKIKSVGQAGGEYKLIEYTGPTQCTGTTCIDEWVHDLDNDIFDAFGIPKEVVEAAATGSGYSGRAMPMEIFLAGRDREFAQYVPQIKHRLLDKLAWLNFGHCDYDIKPKSLLKEFRESQKQEADKKSSTPYTIDGQSRPAPGQPTSDNDAQQFSLDREGHEHAGKGRKGGQFVAKPTGDSGQAKPSSKGKVSQEAAPATTKKQKPAINKYGKAILSDKARRAAANHVLVDSSIQRYSEEYNEPRFAKAVGGVSFPDGEPIDVAIAGKSGVVAHGVELKTMVINGNNKITMKRSAMERKAAWEKKNKAPVHTVVLDDSAVFNAGGQGKHDESKRRIFYRRGYGSFRVQTMHEVKSLAELKKLFATTEERLPPAARRPTGQRMGVLA